MRRRVSLRENMSYRLDRESFNKFGHMQHKSGEQLTERVYESDVEG